MNRVHATGNTPTCKVRNSRSVFRMSVLCGHASTAMMGSRITGAALLKPWRNAYWAASWNAISLLSTECATPSVSAILMPCQAHPTAVRAARKRSLLASNQKAHSICEQLCNAVGDCARAYAGFNSQLTLLPCQ